MTLPEDVLLRGYGLDPVSLHPEDQEEEPMASPPKELERDEIVAKADEVIRELRAAAGDTGGDPTIDDDHPFSGWIRKENARRAADREQWAAEPVTAGDVELLRGAWYNVAIKSWGARPRRWLNCRYLGRGVAAWGHGETLRFERWGGAGATDKYASGRIDTVGPDRVLEVERITVDPRIAAKADAKDAGR